MSDVDASDVGSASDFTFGFTVRSRGWIHADVAFGPQAIHLTLSTYSISGNDTDGVSDLFRAINALLDGKKPARVVWEEEPGYYVWEFERDGADVHMLIAADVDTHLLDARFAREDDNGDVGDDYEDLEVVVFEAIIPLRDLAAAIIHAAEREVSENGVGSYQRRRGSPFPSALLERMRKKLDPNAGPIKSVEAIAPSKWRWFTSRHAPHDRYP